MKSFVPKILGFAAMGLLLTPFAFAADTLCIGSFQNTMYGSIGGLARYQITCDDGRQDSVQKSGTYSSAAHDRLFQERALPLAAKLGLVRVKNRKNNNLSSFDVFRSKSSAPAPTRFATLYRTVYKQRGSYTEHLQLHEDGKETRFPPTVVPAKDDLGNVDRIAAQEGMNRSRAILEMPHSTQIFILFR